VATIDCLNGRMVHLDHRRGIAGNGQTVGDAR
jgi:hypothetical protein